MALGEDQLGKLLSFTRQHRVELPIQVRIGVRFRVRVWVRLRVGVRVRISARGWGKG